MNNQAAQTMPALPEPEELLHSPMHGNVYGFTADQMHQYARDYALSQTAGVAEGIRGKVESVGICGMAHIAVDYTYYGPHILSKGDTFTLLNDKAAAPAASGWNITDRSHEIGFDDGLDGSAASGGEDVPFATTQMVVRALTHLGHSTPQSQEEQYARSNELVLTLCREVMATKEEPQPPAAASVSERARSSMKLLRFGRGNGATPWILEPHIDGYWTPWHTAQSELDMAVESSTQLERALEQALTQQRGYGEAVDRDAWAEALELPQGYTVEEFLPGGWHYAWTRADGERMVSGTTWNHPALAAIAAWQYATATTPQSCAESLRELVQRWRHEARDMVEIHGSDQTFVCVADALEKMADELESLLGRGG